MDTLSTQLPMQTTDAELSDEQLIEMMGQERFEQMMDDDGGDIPTLVYDELGKNNFIKFKDRQDVLSLIDQLASMLAYGTGELAVRVPIGRAHV